MAKKNTNQLLIIGVIVVAALFVFKGGLPGQQTVSGFTDVKRGIVLGTNTITSGTPTVYRGSTLDVKLAVTTSSGNKAITIHEEAPFNIIGLPGKIYETAMIDQIQVQDETKIYQVNPTVGTHSFTGKYSVNGGADQAISGITSINVVSCAVSSESCNNKDDDCDYSVDESLTQTCYTGPAGTQGKGICIGGNQACSTGNWGSCSGQVLPSTEVCNNGIDEDCTGADLASSTKADTNCNQDVDWTEINSAIGKWLSGQYTWTEINQMIATWLV